ncbi:MAG: hypothetical protein Q9173_002725 [Seirophora scorigena]
MASKANDALGSVSASTLLSTFQTNAFGPLLLTQALLPSILKAKDPKLALMSSRVGSIADNSSGGAYSPLKQSSAQFHGKSSSMANNGDPPGSGPSRRSPRQMLRQVLSLPPVQDRVFGDESLGGLTRNDYINLQPYIGPVLMEQDMSSASHDRIFPPTCEEHQKDENNQDYVCGAEPDPDDGFEVQRCRGFLADPGTEKGHRNPGFPGAVRLRLLVPEHRVRRWDFPNVQLRHERPSQFVCDDCRARNHAMRVRQWRGEWPHNSIYPDLQRWFRLCKKHSLLGIAQGLHPNPEALAHRPSSCGCMGRDHPYVAVACDSCQREAQNPWDDRAQHWRRELLHTHKKQGRRQKPKIDWNKPPRMRPVCAWKDCGEKPWYGTHYVAAAPRSRFPSFALRPTSLYASRASRPSFDDQAFLTRTSTGPLCFSMATASNLNSITTTCAVLLAGLFVRFLVLLFLHRRRMRDLSSSTQSLQRKSRSKLLSGSTIQLSSSSILYLDQRIVLFTRILDEYAARNTLFELEDAATKLTVDIIGDVTLDTPLRAQTSDNELVQAFRDQRKWMPLPNGMNLFRTYNPWKFIQH